MNQRGVVTFDPSPHYIQVCHVGSFIYDPSGNLYEYVETADEQRYRWELRDQHDIATLARVVRALSQWRPK